MRIAHLADAHLDSSFGSFSAEVARQRRHGIEASLRKAVEEASGAGVEALVVAGDLYEHERVAPDTGEFLRALFADIAPVRVFVSPGNHDWFGPSSLYARLEWPSNVHVFTDDRLQPIELDYGLTLWGAAHRAPANTDGFLDRFGVERGGVNLALFHGSEQGAFAFQPEGKVPHAPFKAEQISAAGLAHVFCGHFHTPVDAGAYTYPGNPEPLAFGEESALPRGIVIATIHDDGSVERERRVVAETGVHDVTVHVTGCSSGNEIRQRVAESLGGLAGCARVTLNGELAPEVDLSLEDVGRSVSGLTVVPRIGVVTTAYDIEMIRAEGTVRAQFVEDVLNQDLPESLKQKIVVTGLRALEGRSDLEVVQ